jgi:hypothetical protein
MVDVSPAGNPGGTRPATPPELIGVDTFAGLLNVSTRPFVASPMPAAARLP